jgi:hypothetical protein
VDKSRDKADGRAPIWPHQGLLAGFPANPATRDGARMTIQQLMEKYNLTLDDFDLSR